MHMTMTITQAAEFLGRTKNEIKELAEKGVFTKIKAVPDDVRYVLSMHEVNKFKHKIKKLENKEKG